MINFHINTLRGQYKDNIPVLFEELFLDNTQ